MQYLLNDYFPLSETSDTRIEICPGKVIKAQLLAYYKQKGYPIVPVFSCVQETGALPLPNDLISQLDKMISSYSGRRVIVHGISSYLSMLNNTNLKAFFVALKNRVDQQRMQETVLEQMKIINPHEFSNKSMASYMVKY